MGNTCCGLIVYVSIFHLQQILGAHSSCILTDFQIYPILTLWRTIIILLFINFKKKEKLDVCLGAHHC